jgi:sensor histidine kinase YesM
MRHLAFWVVALFGLGLVGMGVRPLFNVEVSQGSFREHVIQPLLYLPGQLFLVYTLLYFAIPRYFLRFRYRLAVGWIVVLSILAGFIATISYDLLFDFFSKSIIHPEKFIMVNGTRFPVRWVDSAPLIDRLPYDYFFGWQAVLQVAGFAAAIKLMKHWYEKEYRNSILQKEKLDAELQSLKAQLHPHFLFNTLNNIYSITENTSPLATGMLLKLSALLRYILYECDRPLVLLSQEFQLIGDYMELERVRYKDLDLKTAWPAYTGQYSIAPLLLLPLVENCFKHGTSRMLEQPWIRIDADLKDGWLSVKLINGRPAGCGGSGKGTAAGGGPETNDFTEGIGLRNVRKRLDLLYPGRHELHIIAEPDLFIVNFKVELEHIKVTDGQNR